jgi:hypothetical protein
MEMPLAAGSQGTGLDLAAAGRFADLIDIAAGHASPDAVLDRWQPGWRQEPPSDFEVFEAADAELGIRLARREEP